MKLKLSQYLPDSDKLFSFPREIITEQLTTKQEELISLSRVVVINQDNEATILNSIFAQNKIGEEATDITPDGNLHVDYTLVNNISGAVDLGTHIIMGEPRFVDAENGYFHLRSYSPAIDVGDDSVVEVEVEVDLDGNPRLVGGAIDLGAYERQ
ncbi:Ig [Candidatus Thiomargarita nelsonii]|uniref:Ig n=1 Tax=Candidatus Thiomargarita nelsonii TaxID=1003181 RepID=A0A0A6NYE9_9GAMM|nr:Ig [Candidatus Thiomargarita nelsonii]